MSELTKAQLREALDAAVTRREELWNENSELKSLLKQSQEENASLKYRLDATLDGATVKETELRTQIGRLEEIDRARDSGVLARLLEGRDRDIEQLRTDLESYSRLLTDERRDYGERINEMREKAVKLAELLEGAWWVEAARLLQELTRVDDIPF